MQMILSALTAVSSAFCTISPRKVSNVQAEGQDSK